MQSRKNANKAMQRGLGGFPHERLHQEAIAITIIFLETAILLNPRLIFLSII
ncbi:hypothetical protein [Pleurocapsa sp. FMAR1]|uniref:hypothetical protein n=1 Tax=Pleurocapsa sp. FMAR1 TaxID=3040204 RepID=UPI0029C6F0AF|nr:hypothetical protein [Pleurocapsa sp. FMAR1]